jgi:hypothetical protein
MPVQKAGVFTIDYSVFTNAVAGLDIQFGMDFTLTNNDNLPLTQLIFPATSVGNNIMNQWNIDNHSDERNVESLIFKNAENGRIFDTPRELSRPGNGVKSTKFSVYRVDIKNAKVQTMGVTFSYEINTSNTNPITVFKGFKPASMTNEEKKLITSRCSYIKFA